MQCKTCARSRGQGRSRDANHSVGRRVPWLEQLSSGKTRSDGSSRGQDCWVDEGVLEGGAERRVGEW